jgi:LuxR family maltose regulon positive regulatory protein
MRDDEESQPLSRALSPTSYQVNRRALVQSTQQSRSDIILISAPVGYGKSIFLRQWLAADGRSNAWLDLQPADNAPGRLATRLATSVAALTAPYVLVLDDLQHVTEHAALAAVKDLAVDLPDGCALACAGRSLPALNLGVLRARRTVLELDLENLAFDAHDAGEVLQARGVTVSAAQVDDLVERTEGWPAAIQMAASAAALASDPERVLREFAGDDRSLVEMLDADVLERLCPDTVEFLLAASALHRLSGALCDEALGRSGSAGLLEHLANDTLLVMPLDHHRQWYRLHRVLLAFLRSEQRIQSTLSPQEVLARASVWFESNGDVDSAVGAAADGHDTSRATELVMQHFSMQVGTGNPLAVQRWLRQIDDTRVATNPSLQSVAALVRLGQGDADGTLRCMRRAEFELSERYPDETPLDQPAACVAALHAAMGRCTAEEMRADARYARRHTKSPVWFALACLADGGASFMLGDLDAAEEALLACTAIAETLHYTSWSLALSVLALVHDRRGNRALAIATARDATHLVSVHELGNAPQLYLVHIIGASFEMAAGREAEARQQQAIGLAHMEKCRGLAPWVSMQANIALATVAHLRGDAHGKARWLDDAESTLLAVPDALLVKSQIAELRALATIPRDGSDGFPALSAAERRVLQYLPTHLALAEIAEKLYLSRHTVKSHVVAVYRKLGVANRSEAVEVAQRRGLIDLTPADGRPDAR